VDAPWKKYVRPGHFFDLVMLEIGDMFWNKGNRGLTEEEYLLCYSLRAFFASPVQLSCRLEDLTEFECDLLMNEEVIAINQDALADFPDELKKDDTIRIYKRALENGDIAYALFNMTAEEREETIDLPECAAIREVWTKENLPAASNLVCKLPPHGARIFRVTPA
jgi:alpha-galactosidase